MCRRNSDPNTRRDFDSSEPRDVIEPVLREMICFDFVRYYEFALRFRDMLNMFVHLLMHNDKIVGIRDSCFERVSQTGALNTIW